MDPAPPPPSAASPAAAPAAATPQPWPTGGARALLREGPVRAVAAVAAVAAAAVAVGLWASYRQTVQAEREVLGVLARAVAAQVDATLQSADATLRGTVAQLDSGELSATAPETVAALARRNAALTLFETLAITDDQGRVLTVSTDASGALPPQRIDVGPLLGERGRFVLAVVATDPPARADAGAPRRRVLAAALPFVAPQGRPRGFVVALAEADYFGRQFGAISPARAAALSLWSDGGALLNASPNLPAGAAAAVQRVLADRRIERPTDGTLPAALAMPSVASVVLQPLASNRFVLAVSRDFEPLLATWRAQAGAVAALAALGLVLALLLAVRSVRHAQRVQAAEAAARDAAAQLALRMQTQGKMEALGTLAGGIAHDFNNVLAAVVGFAEMARDTAPDASAQARHLDRVLQAGLRGKGLVDRILAFSRSGLRPSQRFAAQPVVHQVLGLLAGVRRDDVHVRAELQAEGVELEGDPTLLFECVMNLCTNALQAMPRGGTLTVALHLERGAASQAPSHGAVPTGERLVLAVHDTGHGIGADVLPRIFEPFFSTRRAGPSADGFGSGTGLGLAVVHGAVADLGGGIDVRTAPGQGSTFTLWLPVASPGPRAVPAAARAGAPAGTAAGGQGEVVMLVDDEPALVALGEEMLAAMGYEPVGFTDPRAALAALQRDPQRFDVVLTDHVMPGLSGAELARALHALRPALPVLMLSGHIGLEDGARADLADLAAVLAKPLQRDDLARALRAAIDSARPVHAAPTHDDALHP
jgi:signal transduction histidine kinase/ActR/RegA family two-component response regulator